MLIIILIIFILYTFILRKKLLRDNNYIYYRETPTNDTPAYVGKIIKGHTDGNDIIATILDLSFKNYIEIKIEMVNGKQKRVLYLIKNAKKIELEEHELFLINQIFKNENRIIFDDYIKSSKFKKDFKAFDNMLDRRVERKSIYKSSRLKNINKIILLTSFSIFGITIFYSILLPIIINVMQFSIQTKIIINISVSVIINVFISNKYISYINKSTNTQENINLYSTYIILSIIVGVRLIFFDFEKMLSVLYIELYWYRIIINFILSVVVLLYMFNIINHTEKQEYLYYFFLVTGIISIILDLKIVICFCIIFFATYIFLKSPRNTIFKQNDFIYKWISFKRYLEDYSMLSEQEENAIIIWEKYLIYAIALGINRKIIRKYGRLSKNILINEQYVKRFYMEYLE